MNYRMQKPYAILGDYNVACQVCYQNYKASECQIRWDNLFVCPTDYETRQPQDFVRGMADRQVVYRASPNPPPNFIEIVTADEINP